MVTSPSAQFCNEVLSAVTATGGTTLTPEAVASRADRGDLGDVERFTLAGFVRLAAEAEPALSPVAARYVRALGVSAAQDERLAAALCGLANGPAARALADPSADAVTAIGRWVAQATASPGRITLTGLTADAFAHPEDRRVLAAFRAIPGVSGQFSRFIDSTRARGDLLNHLGNAVEVNSGTAPALYGLYAEVCDTLALERRPRLFLEPGAAGAYTLGTTEPVVVLSTLTSQQLQKEELRYVLGHELGHVMAGHYPYHQFARELETGIEGAAAWLLGRLVPSSALLAPLAAWRRCSELTADRAGLLACQNREAAIRAMMVFAGLPARLAARADVAAYVAQAREYAARRAEPGQAIRTAEARLTQTHPMGAERLLALLAWEADGGYAEVLAADAAGRRALAKRARFSDDPAWDALAEAALRTFQGWACARLGLTAKEVGPSARRLLLDGLPAEGPLAAVLEVRLTVERVELTRCAAVLEVTTAAEDGADVDEFPVPIEPTWEGLPQTFRSRLIRGGGQSVSHLFFPPE